MLFLLMLFAAGTTEAFTRAVSTPSDIKVYNYLLIGFSCTYVVAAMNLIPYFDTAGLILADCLSTSSLHSLGLLRLTHTHYRSHSRSHAHAQVCRCALPTAVTSSASSSGSTAKP